MTWTYTLAKRAEKDMERLDRVLRARIFDALDRLVVDPTEGDTIKLKGRPEWRHRVGDWRLLFERDDAERTLHILRVLPRGAAYRE